MTVSKKTYDFCNQLGGAVGYNLNKPFPDFTAAAVQDYINLVILKNLFTTSTAETHWVYFVL
ncbi:hypothetical protein [Desulfosporosinus fructosivorans]